MGRKKLYSNDEAIERNRERSARLSRAKSASVKEIGPLPKVLHPARKKKCRDSLLKFMLTYGGTPESEELYTFVDPFCEEQLFMIQTLEEVLIHGGEVPLCIFRGGCKTTLCEWGILWALAYGHQRFALVVACNQASSRRIIANIKTNIQLNPILAADFPEICHPIAKLERANQRAATQTLNGIPTEIKFTADSLILPRVAKAKSSQAIVCGVGADSSFRGLRIGKQRPTFVLLDDPQTNKSAHSITQTDARWENITSSIKGLAGPGVKLAMVATVTVIKKGDLAEKILERWHGKRFGILRSMPKNMDAWNEYNEEAERCRIEVSSIPECDRIMKEYYLKHRDILDEGAEAAWNTNFTTSEASAIQYAMNLYYFDQKAFWSEYMNLPIEEEKDAENLTIQNLEAKIRKELPKGIAPLDCSKITAGIDIQKDCLYWLVVAWGSDFSGHVLEYGRFPKGSQTMAAHCPGMSFEEQVETCLGELGEIMRQCVYYREESKEELEIDKIIADANWGLVQVQIKKACRRQMPRGFMEPTLGWGKGPDQRFLAKRKKPGEERGPEWHKPPLEIKGICRTITYNTNYWKSFVRSRIQAGLNARSTMTFYAGDSVTHKKLFRHLLGETSSKLTGQYGTIDKWILTPGQPNHWWDCLVMASVAASVTKIAMIENHVSVSTGKKSVHWVDF